MTASPAGSISVIPASHVLGRKPDSIIAGVTVPFLLEPYTGSTTIFFCTMVLFVAAGAFIVLFGTVLLSHA